MAGNDEVFMDIPQVEKMAQSFDKFGDTLEDISKAMAGIAQVLKATAWLSLGMTYGVGVYLEKLAPKIKSAAEKMRELSKDLTSAIRAYQFGDFSGSRHFC